MRLGTVVRILFTLGVGWLFVPDELLALPSRAMVLSD